MEDLEWLEPAEKIHIFRGLASLNEKSATLQDLYKMLIQGFMFLVNDRLSLLHKL